MKKYQSNTDTQELKRLQSLWGYHGSRINECL